MGGEKRGTRDNVRISRNKMRAEISQDPPKQASLPRWKAELLLRMTDFPCQVPVTDQRKRDLGVISLSLSLSLEFSIERKRRLFPLVDVCACLSFVSPKIGTSCSWAPIDSDLCYTATSRPIHEHLSSSSLFFVF